MRHSLNTYLIDKEYLERYIKTSIGQLSEANEKVAELTEFKATQVKAAAEAKTASRLAQLTELLGDDQAVSMNASLASLSDDAFSGVLTSLGVKSKTEADTPLFKEVGVDGEVDSTKLEDDVKSNGVMHILAAKYPKK
jgi:hypothetical protein